MVKNLLLLQRVGNNGRPWVHAVMCDNTYSDICMMIHGESCFNFVKLANRYWLHMNNSDNRAVHNVSFGKYNWNKRKAYIAG